MVCDLPRRRVALFEFTQRFEGDKADKDLLPKLEAEASGILNLLLKAVQQWNKAGLTKTRALTDATNQYRNDQDLVGDFLRTETSTSHTLTIAKSQLYHLYKRWAEDSGVRSLRIVCKSKIGNFSMQVGVPPGVGSRFGHFEVLGGGV